MPPDVRAAAARAFWTDDKPRSSRPKRSRSSPARSSSGRAACQALPVDKRAKHLAGIAQVSDLLAARLLVVYHLEHQRPMMGAFLDALGIAHDEGLIKDESPKAPDAEALDHGRRRRWRRPIRRPTSPRYFWTLLWQDPDTWGGLQDRPELAELA